MRYEDVQHRNHAINYHGCCLDEFVSNILQRTPDAGEVVIMGAVRSRGP